MRQRIIELFGSLGMVLVVAVIGGIWTGSSISEWYVLLRHPLGTPPNWVFGPVWSLLYLAMALSFWLFLGTSTWKENRVGITLFVAQLMANMVWSGLFFGLRNLLLGLIDIAILILLVATTILVFSEKTKTGALLLLPYLLWILYAAYLNAGFWYLNL
jgi:tryptophan-rich sensory protein